MLLFPDSFNKNLYAVLLLHLTCGWYVILAFACELTNGVQQLVLCPWVFPAKKAQKLTCIVTFQMKLKKIISGEYSSCYGGCSTYYALEHMRWRHTMVGLCIYVYICNSNFLKVTKNQALANAVQAQHNNILNLIVLDYWIKALFSSYGMICSPWTLLWHIPDFPEDQSARSGSLYILILESIQQLQLLTARLRSKNAIQANWI